MGDLESVAVYVLPLYGILTKLAQKKALGEKETTKKKDTERLRLTTTKSIQHNLN